jgi:hypothetical protein
MSRLESDASGHFGESSAVPKRRLCSISPTQGERVWEEVWDSPIATGQRQTRESQ